MLYLLSEINNNAQFGDEGGYQTVGDVFKNGGPVFLVGFLTVIAVLALIWGILELFHYFAYTLPHKKTAPAAPADTVPAAPSEVVPDTSDEEIVAVIAAAIAAAQSEKPEGDFRVVSFRRK